MKERLASAPAGLAWRAFAAVDIGRQPVLPLVGFEHVFD